MRDRPNRGPFYGVPPAPIPALWFALGPVVSSLGNQPPLGCPSGDREGFRFEARRNHPAEAGASAGWKNRPLPGAKESAFTPMASGLLGGFDGEVIDRHVGLKAKAF